MSPPRHVVARERAVRLENEKNTMDYYNAMRCVYACDRSASFF